MELKKAHLESLVEMATKLDDEGRTEEAMALDLALQKLAAASEDEKEEKGPRAMSGKAKAKFRAVKKAAEALCTADLDYRGPHKKECRKVEQLCEEIIEAIKDCDFE